MDGKVASLDTVRSFKAAVAVAAVCEARERSQADRTPIELFLEGVRALGPDIWRLLGT
jgi:hypothetical protein